LVGCVITHKGVIIGEGWHYKAGEAHAEVNAINSVKDKSVLKDATIYVSLEPCSHFGKTPPCANLIIQHNIPNVVVGCIDSFSEVSGKGIQMLRNHGCNVIVGVLEKECLVLNKRFFTYHNKKRPYIILKWAESIDGFIAPKNNNKITWITNNFSRQLVHKLRTEEQAILVGTNTAIIDNPKLNARNWKGSKIVRVIIDKDLKTPKENHIYDGSLKTIILTVKKRENKANLFFEIIDFDKEITSQICNVLYQHKLQSVIIEGGSKTLQSFIKVNLWDQAHIYKGVTMFEKGIQAPKINGRLAIIKNIKNDSISIYNND
jgi:diaminohydroxyphosphoribosylaminopyrimidine deaminase / 5-amino-6-(5-phosphoribosylamino)uracil reductase